MWLVPGVWRVSGLLVITVRGDQIAALTRFESNTVRPFGLPRILPGNDPPRDTVADITRLAATVEIRDVDLECS